ncbi:UDP-N-acetylglucosamine 1-carboxyvinyltransferase [Candidatus Epulonipiscium fishelsonii]|uniref:UDP-N-acetylglucosamine 1-carboxyvinyltransferase n=1 Tax=Candidatus Epulonipiscium fishelsonii TaxID=77094 RepID=A0ACC8X6V7_9FIRM|nr:UDP-N-acetylglucosamine 1-carboxyvinyltransferase [Epulopiscium sp. SCG-B11WGA-EpuloA1]ONI41458.1 UDP-N-acetylglucosamine 1-carboxyvinyltransferase [Epulopiscium sp. SCG-B05WGA-EpuloA1]
MSELCIRGGNRLMGNVVINGAKNAAVAILPATILVDGVSTIENLPNIDDVIILNKAIQSLGATTQFLDEHTLEIDASTLNNTSALDECISKMRASYYLIGALVGRFGRAKVAMPGGCDFGGRPIDQHIKGFEAMGATVKIEKNMIEVTAKQLVGARIYLDVVSVGATINIMLAAVLAQGTTIIENSAKEPHIVDVANFLNKMGANIKGAGTNVIRVRGVEKLHSGRYTTVPDQIEAGTYMIAAAITGGDVYVRNIIPEHMESVSYKMREMGIGIEEGDDYIRVFSNGRLKSTNVKTLPYPGFPTDLQPQMSVLLSVADGESVMIEGVFENRFQYIDQLKETGAIIRVEGNKAIIQGVDVLKPATLKATDLRAGAAMILAGLKSEGGETVIHNIKYIDRGYEQVEKKLSALGAQIYRQ